MAAPMNLSLALSLLLVIFLLSLQIKQHPVCAQGEDEIPKIGIIGGGIGGTSAAYFLKQLFGDKLEIDLFEGERVGGRLALISIDGQDYEAGGAVIHPKNQYMVNFTKLFGLEKRKGDDGSKLGLFNSEHGLYFETSSWSIITLAKLFWRYGLDLRRIQDFVADTLVSFSRIYDYQIQGMAFTTVEDLLRAMDEKFVNYTRIKTRTMFRDAGFSDIFIDEIVMGSLQTNYGQTPDVHGFVGAVSMAGAEPGLWAVKGGNKLVADKLLDASGAKLLRGAVTHVFQVKGEGGTVSYEVQYDKMEVNSGDGEKNGLREYDLLIIATPVQSGAKFKIQFEDFPSSFHLPDVPYHSLETLFVHGQPNTTFFGTDCLDSFPAEILTTDTDVFFNSLGRNSPVTQKEHLEEKTDATKDYGVWKSFLNKVPTENQLNYLFDSHKDLRLVSWLAYPEYTPKMDLPSFVLHDRLYYINAVEAAASAMEMSVIGARNVALLAFNQWFGHFDKIDETVFPSREGEARRTDEL